MRFSEMVSRSLAARIESMMVVNDASISGGTVQIDISSGNAVSRSEGGAKGRMQHTRHCDTSRDGLIRLRVVWMEMSGWI